VMMGIKPDNDDLTTI